jgi:hypothetical protein
MVVYEMKRNLLTQCLFYRILFFRKKYIPLSFYIIFFVVLHDTYKCIIFNLTVNFFGQKDNFIYCSIIYKLVTALNNLVTTLKSGRGTLIGVRWLDRAPRQVGLGDGLA